MMDFFDYNNPACCLYRVNLPQSAATQEGNAGTVNTVARIQHELLTPLLGKPGKSLFMCIYIFCK